MSTAKIVVISTPELLELVLSHLPMRDLLVTAPLVSKTHWPGKASYIMSMPWSKAPDAFKREEASWRRMLVIQPPAQKMTVTETCHGEDGDSERRAVLDDLSLRMGILYDLTIPFIDRAASRFCIRWHDNSGAEGDLTLAAIFVKQCRAGSRRLLDKRFSSDGAKSTKINFGRSPRA
ncbi:hypothetical protein DFH09DRAFT_1283352 [Mycena vulgaris]|nr:hypothetical protein DFH09DRAFT_1283352 [Mycena vulgaris]